MKIAFHRTCITPDVPSYLCGHAMRVALSKGVLDDLYCSVVLLKQPEESFLFASFDLVGIDQELIDLMSEYAQSKGIKKDHVIISVIHTHSGPEYMVSSIFQKDPDKGARPGYREQLVEKFKEALDGCDDFKEVSAKYGTTQVEGFYGNRNHIDYPADKSANFIRFVDEQDNDVYLICNLTCHPTVLGPQNLYLSADLFGALRDKLSNQYGVPVFMMNGAQGDVSNRQYRQGNDEKELKRMSEGIYGQLKNIEYHDLCVEPMKWKDITYVIDYMSDPQEMKERLVKAKAELAQATNPDTIKVTKSGIAFIEGNLTADPHVHIEIKTRLLQMGELYIVTIGAEMFSKFAIEIKEALKDNNVIIWGITDDSVGYLVEESEYGKNYESMTTRIPKGEIERYVAHIIKELKAFVS